MPDGELRRFVFLPDPDGRGPRCPSETGCRSRARQMVLPLNPSGKDPAPWLKQIFFGPNARPGPVDDEGEDT